MHSLAGRLELAAHIQELWYPSWASPWLKAVPVAPMLPQPSAAAIVQAFLDGELHNHMPEDSAWGTLTDSVWRALDRAEMLRCVDEILAASAGRIAKIRAAEALEGPPTSSNMCLLSVGAFRLDDEKIDLDEMRRWFTDELWGADAPAWFTNTGPGFEDEPAVIGVDGDILAILWLP